MTEGHEFTFPDESKGELDVAIDELVAKAKGVLATQGRLRALLKANQAVVQHRDLPVVLRQIVESAVELVGAEYGALGVVSADGRLEQFITVGMSDELIAHIGHLPEGHGLLGALIDDPHTIRLDHLDSDPRSAGFPAGHPSMDSFLGVPIAVRGEVFGNLYLSNQRTGRFNVDDEQLVTALAATAGIAIENARLFAETKRRQLWSAASAEITSTLLSSEHSDSISTVASRVMTLSDSDVVWILFPDDRGGFTIERARGFDAEFMEGSSLAVEGNPFGSVLEAQQPQLLADGGAAIPRLPGGQQLGPSLVVPLGGALSVSGVMLVARVTGSHRFTIADLEMAADFAGQASIAMELGVARADKQRMLLLEDRSRIARDLHDHVIQQLFATGLELHSIAASTAVRQTSDRIIGTVATIDASIAQIRTAIFALEVRDDDARDTMRHKLVDLINEMSPGLRSTPALSFSGPVDLAITDDLATDVLAVAREALANVIKHASAQTTAIELRVSEGIVSLLVRDDGIGFVDTGRRSGIENLHQRAERRGGHCTLASNDGFTVLSWLVPLEPADAGASLAGAR